MKAITLTQPYATLIAIGAKRIETRGWSTSYRGDIAIHAASGFGPVGGVRGLRELVNREPFRSVLGAWGERWGRDVLGDPSYHLPTGEIVAVARLDESCSLNLDDRGRGYYWSSLGSWARVSEQESAFGDFSRGRYGFRLRRVRAAPRGRWRVKGALQLWEWDVAPHDLAFWLEPALSDEV